MKPQDDYKPLQVEMQKNDSVERLIKRFMKKVKKEKILDDYKETLEYVKPSMERKRKKERRLRIARKITEQQKEKE